MKKQVLLVIFLFFGLAFLVYLFSFIFVEAAKLQSGVTINAPSTTETEKICDDTIDNDNDGKVDAADEDCAGAPTGPAAGTCGLQIVSGVPINYGQLNQTGRLSAEQKVTIKNLGTATAKIMVKGGDWISDEAGIISGPEATHVALPTTFPLSYHYKRALTSDGLNLGGIFGGQGGEIFGGQSTPIIFQFLAWEGSDLGSYHQEVSIDLLC